MNLCENSLVLVCISLVWVLGDISSLSFYYCLSLAGVLHATVSCKSGDYLPVSGG